MAEMICKKIKLDHDPDIIEIHDSNLIECPLCLKLVSMGLESHFNLEHGELECLFCGRSFANDIVLNEHINKMHLNDDLIHNKVKGKKK